MTSIMSNSFGDQNTTQNKSNIVFIDRIVSILSENKLNIWFDFGLKDEYFKRFNEKLPNDWIQVMSEHKDIIEVEICNYSNVTQTMIKLPLPKKRALVKPMSLPITEICQKPITPEVKPIVVPNIDTNVTKDNNSEKIMEIENDLQNKENEEKNEIKQNNTENQKNLKSVTTNGSDSLLLNALNYCEASGDDVIYGGKPIPPAVLPEIKPNPINAEDFFDVVVLLAATPNNFIVIPFKNINKDSDFSQMKQKMFEMYEKEENRIELPSNVITNGLFVAGKYHNIWYRMQVKQVICREPFQVMCYLCDYGEHQTLDLKDIQPLYNVFRELPMQALRASLASAEPIGSDWDVMTSVEFRKMVENRPFVATVFEINTVDDEPVISLSLCDTTGADDVYIGKALIEKGLAKPKIARI